MWQPSDAGKVDGRRLYHTLRLLECPQSYLWACRPFSGYELTVTGVQTFYGPKANLSACEAFRARYNLKLFRMHPWASPRRRQGGCV